MKRVIVAAAGLLLGPACKTSVPHRSTLRQGSLQLTVEASAERTRHLMAAFDEVQAILEDPRFAEAIDKLDGQLLATSADGTCRTTKASDVLAALKARLPDHVMGSRCSFWHPLSTAGAGACSGFWINTGRIDYWESESHERRGTFINTLAHEMTHVLPEEGRGCSDWPPGAYTDEGHAQCSAKDPQCSDAFLVSYVWGDLIECAYRVRHGVIPEAEFHACFMGLVNSGNLDRAKLMPKFDEASSQCQGIKAWKAAESP